MILPLQTPSQKFAGQQTNSHQAPGRALVWLVAILLAVAATAPHPTPASELRPASFREAFPTLAQRNIFDPTRSKSRPFTPVPSEEKPQERPRLQFFNLTGTMLYGGNAYAFFVGSEPDYHQTLSPQETIAGLTIVEITTANVILQKDTNQWALSVGKRMQREGAEPWQVASAAPAPSSPSSAASSQTETREPRSNDSKEPSPPTPEMTELMKRLMERREKEITP